MRILNLGAGVQSTAVFLMSHEGEIEAADYAIFADTQEEPAAVYQHLQWLRTIPAPVPVILVGTVGKLGDDLMVGRNSTGGRFASIPCFTAQHHDQRTTRDGCREGITRRQCTKEYKIEVVERMIRRDVLRLKPRQRIPKDVHVTQLFGISWDERKRADRIRLRFDADIKWASVEFPLIDKRLTRQDCLDWLKGRVPHQVPRSACVFCPYKSAVEWQKTKENPEEWARAVEVDRALRVEGNVVNRNMDQALYLHRQCVPLEMIDFEAEAAKEAAKKRTPLFALLDCGEGMCGV
jgi:hypothetical protein